MTPEVRIRRLICSYLTWKHPEIFFWVSDRVGIYNVKRGAFMANRDPYRIKGVSDILGIFKPSGRFLAIEVKTRTGRVSEEQKAFIANINSAGGVAFVARNVEDVEAALSKI